MRADRPAEARGRPGCPVCGCPIAHEETLCAECRWPLHGGWRLGAPGAGDVRDFEARLAAARRERDLRAAVRAGRSAAPFVRGGEPTEREWAEAARIAAAPPVSDDALAAQLAAALEPPRRGRALVVAEVGADVGLTVVRIEPDALGVPRVPPAADTALAWEAALPMLSRDPDERRFQLAGGLADVDRDMLWRALREALPARLGDPGDDVLLVHRDIGWPVPDRTVRILRRANGRARVVPAGSRTVSDLLAPLLAALPSPHDIGLLAVGVEPGTRRLRPRLLPLFPAGSRAGAESAVPLARPPGDADSTVLAAVAAAPDGWTVLTAGAAKLPAAGRTDVRAVLDGPGAVRFTAPGPLSPVTARLPDLLAGVPDRLEILTEPVDLICAVELGGPGAAVARRLALLRDLLAELDLRYGSHPRPGLVRAAVFGYGDHAYGRGRERRKTVSGAWLAAPAEALRALSGLRASPVAYPEAAPVEDVLHEVAGRLPPPAARAARTVLLTVGARPPHPAVQGDDDVLPCQFELSWRTALGGLVRAGVECAVVVDAARAPDPDHRAWAELGALLRHDLDDTDTTRLGAGLGLLPSAPQTLDLPLADPERGAR
ncbi:hypothetical protein [Actinomadura sp. WAC 06369]|uniref:hypothetical protein n=1 Tax=Actinomadura sp. WAC 06369 TaxID=2203193 RepID=UPI000F767800|nr:hypothetical protein [Actinomadura sp. WAC 06369]RSN48577.1 hypothetical protein DMH08_33780 [Actinomadura sp. WAC 06369]